MALVNSSVAITPGAGESIASQDYGGKEHQAIVRVDGYGHVIGARDVYVMSATAMAKAASKVYQTLWNGDASLTVEVVYAAINQELTAAVTGLVRGYRLSRVNAAPTLGTTLTAVKLKSSSPALDADIVGRSNGVTATAVGDPIGIAGVAEEETGAGGAAPHILFSELFIGEPIILAPSEGIMIAQDSTAGTGLLSSIMVFRVR